MEVAANYKGSRLRGHVLQPSGASRLFNRPRLLLLMQVIADGVFSTFKIWIMQIFATISNKISLDK